MRTSRISRDTSRAIAAIRTRSSARQAQTGTASTSQSLTNSQIGNIKDEYDELSASSDGETKIKRKRASTVVVKQEVEEVSVDTIESPKKETRPKKARRVPAKKVKLPNGEEEVVPPPNWEKMYTMTREMRNGMVAPVDTMGCESLADRNQPEREQRFQTLVALMLSSQTKDTVTSVAIRGMQERMPGGFNLESVLAIEPTELNAFINKVGFHNLKTKYIKQTATILKEKWNSDIPDTIEGLTSLPGVGPKMAYLTMSAAWGRDEGIGVDVHVHRITNLWGWNKTQQPEQTRMALQSWLPRDKWHDINNLLVGLGQTICLPVGRKCGECTLAAEGLCPSASVPRKSVTVKKETRTVEVKVESPERTKVKKEEETQYVIRDIEDIGS